MSIDFNGNFSLFPAKEKKTDRSPDYNGTIELSLDQAMAMAEWITAQPGEPNYKGETVVKLRLAGWKKTSQGGMAYLGGKLSPQQAQQSAAASDEPLF